MRMPRRSARENLAVWPVVLRENGARPPMVLRPLRRSDEHEWNRLRAANTAHVGPWEPTLPPGTPVREPATFARFIRDLDREARADRALPWCIEVDARIVGQVHLFGIVRAAQQSAAVGYWLSESDTGRGLATRALALAIDHALGPAGLHRVEVNIRGDNARSLAVVERLGLRDEGVRQRFLHIDGQWRDHRTFAVTNEDLSGQGSLTARLSQR